MHVHLNQALIKARVRVSVVFLVISLVLLSGGFVLSSLQEEIGLRYAISVPSLVLGLMFWFQNQSYLARWGPRGRQDGPLRAALKGLDSRYHLFVFPGASLPDYIVVGPIGVLVVIPRAMPGTVRYVDGRWRHDSRVPTLLRFLIRFSPHDVLGDLTADAREALEHTRRYLQAHADPDLLAATPVEVVIAFVHPNVHLEVANAPVAAVHGRALRNHMRRLPRVMNGQQVEALAKAIEEAA